MSTEVDPEAVLANYPSEFLECREGHPWSRKIFYDIVDQDHSERLKECTNCGLRRVELVNIHTYERIGRLKYRKRPPGYLTPKTGLTRSDFRTRQFQEEFAEATKAGQSGAVTPIGARVKGSRRAS
jgi:hypothetical protein